MFKKSSKINLNKLYKTDIFLWVLSALISLYSLLLLMSVSRENNFGYFKTHLISICLGYIGAFIVVKLGYVKISKYWPLIAFFCILFMLSTFFLGTSVVGNSGVDAKAWVKLPGNVTFQPSELMKIGFMVTFSVHLNFLKNENKLNKFKSVLLLGLHALIPMGLSHFQGDDGAAVIFFFMFLIMCYIAGINLRYFIILFFLIAASLPYVWNHVLAQYQKQRLLCQLNPEVDPLGMGFQQIQSKISIGSGKILGLGLFNGPRVSNGSVPIQHSDFVFSVVGEELGFVGCLIAILLLMLLVFKTIKISNTSKDSLGSFICFGFLGIIVSQMIFNLGMCLSLLPVMGVTFPFFSAGGTSIACLYLGLGLVQSVCKNRENLKNIN